MKEQLAKRVEQLKAEFESGQKMLAELDSRRGSLQQTLLRISGAIQALEEELAKEQAPDDETGAKRDEALRIAASR